MRRLAACAALAAAFGCASLEPAWERPPPAVQEGPIVPAERLHRSVLDNGLEVLVLEDHRVPRLEIGVVLRRGSEIESTQEAGTASLMADVMERGAGSRDALALARAFDDMGASLSASAGWDSVGVGVEGLSEDGDRLFELLADVTLRPRFDPSEVTRARSEQLASLEQDKDSPETLLWRQVARTLYDGHRYGVPAEGEPATVARIDVGSLRAFHRRLFGARNAIVYVVGDIDPADALSRVRQHFGGWEGGEVEEPGVPPPAPTPAARRVIVVDRPDLGQAQIALAHEGIARSEPERIPALLMNTVLGGGGFLSRLTSRVRADEGLTYAIGSGFSMRRWPGPFAVGTSTRVPETGRVVGLVIEELERMQGEPPSAADLQLVKSFTAGRFVLGLETSNAIAAALVDLDVYDLPRDSLDTYRARINQTSQAELAAAAERRLHPERIAIVVVGPAQALVPQLERFGPVEVVKP